MMNSLMVNILKCAFIWHNRFQIAFKYMILIYFQSNKPEGRRDMVTESLSSFLRYHGQWVAKSKPTPSFVWPPPPKEVFGFPRWLSCKEFTCQHWRHGFNPWARKIPWRREWQPTPVFLPGKSYGQRSMVGYNPSGRERVRHDQVITQQEVFRPMSYSILAFITMIYNCLFTCISSLFCKYFGGIPSTRKMPNSEKKGNKCFFNGWIND